MIGLLLAFLFCIAILAMKLWDCSANLDRAEYRIDLRGAEIKELKQRCEGHEELIEALSKSVRELNGVVEEAVKVKEETSDDKPDTKALIGGWSTDDTKTTWLDDILAKIRKEKEKPVDDTYYLGVGVDDDKMLKIPVRDTGQTLVDGEPIRHGRLWTNPDTIDRKAAIDRFNVIRPVDPKKDEYTKGIDVGIAMCIVAVKDQPTIQPEKAQLSKKSTTSDLISRQVAIDAVNAIGHIATMPDGDKCVRRSAVKYTLSMLPSAQPEPHEGHWIKHIDLFDGEQYECSECGVLWEFADGTPEDNEAFYCPKCGAKMKGN